MKKLWFIVALFLLIGCRSVSGEPTTSDEPTATEWPEVDRRATFESLPTATLVPIDEQFAASGWIEIVTKAAANAPLPESCTYRHPNVVTYAPEDDGSGLVPWGAAYNGFRTLDDKYCGSFSVFVYRTSIEANKAARWMYEHRFIPDDTSIITISDTRVDIFDDRHWSDALYVSSRLIQEGQVVLLVNIGGNVGWQELFQRSDAFTIVFAKEMEIDAESIYERVRNR